MLNDDLKNQLRVYLERVVRPIHITASLNDSPKSREMQELLGEIAAQSDQISLDEVHGDGQRAPSFSLSSPGHDISLCFAGLPMGHEFTSLVLALLQVGGHPPKVEQSIIEQIKALNGDFIFETYFSQSCQNCPDVVQALNLMAVLNPRIRHTAIDGGVFPQEVEERQVMSVPTVYLNGRIFGQGRMGLEEILEKLDSSISAREAVKINAKAPFDVLVVGGGPAGAAAAIYAARKGIRTGLVAERFGGQVLNTTAIENFISVPHTEGPQMVTALEQHVRDYDVDIMNLQRVQQLSREGQLFKLVLKSGAHLRAKTVILSTGARWRQLNVPGEDLYRNKGVAYCPHCDGPLFKGKKVAVVGGGNSGAEAAIDLAGSVAHVTLIERDGVLHADDILQRKLRSLPNVEIITAANTTEVVGDGVRVTGIVYENRDSGVEHKLVLDGVFVQIGLLPNTEWLQDTVELSARGEVIVNAACQTSVPGVFAAGDCTTVPYKQIVIAMGEGAKASLAAFDYLIRE